MLAQKAASLRPQRVNIHVTITRAWPRFGGRLRPAVRGCVLDCRLGLRGILLKTTEGRAIVLDGRTVPTERIDPIPDLLGFLSGVFGEAPCALQVFHSHGRSVLTNAAYERLFWAQPPDGYSVFQDEFAVSRGVADAVRRALSGEVVELPAIRCELRRLNQVDETESRRTVVSGTFFPLHGRAGAVEYVGAVYRDVAAEVEAREYLENANASLARVCRE